MRAANSRLLAILVPVLAMLFACEQRSGLHRAPADAVFLNGRVYTVDEHRSWAEAFAVRDGKFVSVGSNDEVSGYVGDDTEIFDLADRLVMPGLHDAHVHLIPGYRQYYVGCRLPGNQSVDGGGARIDDLLNALAACADQEAGRIGWVLGGGFGLGLLSPDTSPLTLIDEYFPDRPVFFLEEGSHAAWANSRALEIAGVDKDTPDPQFSTLWRDQNGEPQGILIDYAAMELVGRHIGTPPMIERIDMARRAIAVLNSVGVTSFVEAGTMQSDLVALRRLARDGRLNARIMTSIIAVRSGDTGDPETTAAAIRQLAEEHSAPRLNAHAAKIWLDGVYLNNSVAFDHMESPHPWLNGNLVVSAEQVAETMVALDSHGLQTKIHALGDYSEHVALDAIEAARNANPEGRDHLHHHLAHSVFARQSDLSRFEELNSATDVTAFWAQKRLVGGLGPLIGMDYALDNGLLLRTMLDHGVRLVGASDWPSAPASPFYSIQVGITRQDPANDDSEVLNPAERLTVEELVDMYTVHGAWLMQQEDTTGSIESGKAADFIIVDRDIFEADPQDIGDTRVLATVIEGQAVFHAEDSPLIESAEGLERAGFWW